MANRIQEVSGNSSENVDIAEFLAAFVRDGELGNPREGDCFAEVWSQRFRWWWDENPFCRPDSHRGFVLRNEAHEIVGFNGMIPFDYVLDGEIVPTLVATSLFVREAHRNSVMGLMARQRALSQDYQMIDSSPSPEVRHILTRLGYQNVNERSQFFFPLSSLGGELSRGLLRCFGLCFELQKVELESGGYLANSAEEIESIPGLKDGKLRMHSTVESLRWLTEAGSVERSFFGLCDPFGELIAYAIGIYKRKWGLTACMLMDYVDFRPDQKGLSQLIRGLTERPRDCGLLPETDLITWSTFDQKTNSVAPGLKRKSILHYQLPRGHEDWERASVPLEGDLFLL